MSATEKGFEPSVRSLDECVPLDPSVPTIIVISNFGTGEPPDNAKAFFKWLQSADGQLSGLKFAVFGLGNREYGGMYQHTGKVIDEKLTALGGARLVARGEGDSARGNDPEDDFESWMPACLDALNAALPLSPAASDAVKRADPAAINAAEDAQTHVFSIASIAQLASNASVVSNGVVFELPHARPVHAATADAGDLASPTRPMLARVVEHRELHGLASPRSCAHVAFRIGDPGPAFGDARAAVGCGNVSFRYETGDYIGIYPENSGEDVENALSGLRHCRGIEGNFSAAVLSGSALVNTTSLSASAIAAPHARFPTTLDTMLRYYVDLSRPAPRRLLRLMSAHAATERERSSLEAMIELARPRQGDGNAAVDVHAISTSGVLARVSHSLLNRLGIEQVLSHTNPQQARFYSISSASSVHPDEAWVACGRSVHWDANRMSSFVGCSSRSLARLRPGDAALVFPIHSDFRLHELATDAQPIVMIANGSGMAPFRAFIEERRARKARGATYLIYGCMYPDQDYLYDDDIEAWNAEGACEANIVFSHHEAEKRGGKLQFVQHRLVAGDPIGERVWQLVHGENAPVFLCGTPLMGEGVTAAFNELAKVKGAKLGGATSYVEMLRAQKRYIRDVFK
jgi:sulfite reductase alpha subunit-like flavoprotein